MRSENLDGAASVRVIHLDEAANGEAEKWGKVVKLTGIKLD
jgi:hypothetical protein